MCDSPNIILAFRSNDLLTITYFSVTVASIAVIWQVLTPSIPATVTTDKRVIHSKVMELNADMQVIHLGLP